MKSCGPIGLALLTLAIGGGRADVSFAQPMAPLPLERPYPRLPVPRPGVAAERISTLIKQCRERYPKVARNPSRIGGLQGFRSVSGPFLICAYGSLETVKGPELEEIALIAAPGTILVLRSTGGPVATWLEFAERLQSKVSEVVVDGACFSSCANYGFVLGSRKIVTHGALVVWHGGPTSSDVAGVGVPAHKGFAKLAKRTEILYRRLGVNLDILNETGRADFSEEAIRAASRRLNLRPQDLTFRGYALPPHVLTSCFGIKGVRGMWDPGSEDATIAAGLSRSRSLLIARLPASLRKRCPAAAK